MMRGLRDMFFHFTSLHSNLPIPPPRERGPCCHDCLYLMFSRLALRFWEDSDSSRPGGEPESSKVQVLSCTLTGSLDFFLRGMFLN